MTATQPQVPRTFVPPVRRSEESHQRYATRMLRVAAAIERLADLDIDVRGIDLDRPRPVITIANCAAVRHLGYAVPYVFGHDRRGRMRRYQVLLEGCRVEWDVVGH